MAVCLYCFLKNEYQDRLKRKVFGRASYEKTLIDYSDLYCKEFMKISHVNNCRSKKRHLGLCANSPKFKYKDAMGNWSPEVIDFINEVTDDIKNHIIEVRDCFTEIIDIYKSQSLPLLISFIAKRCSSFKTENNIVYTKPWFRAREVGTYNPHDISEMFHIPYTKMELTGNQRFSVRGQPYLYLAESLCTASAEIGVNENKLNAALFIPKYSHYYRKGAYNIGNSFLKNLNSFVCSSEYGSQLKYNNDVFTFSKQYMAKELADTILFQIMQFPTQASLKKGDIIPEYILPQMFMTYQTHKGMTGILYESSKNIRYRKYSKFETQPSGNLCMPSLKPKIVTEKYNKDFLNTFFYATYKAGEPKIYMNSLRANIEECKRIIKTKADKYNMNDYYVYLSGMENHIDNMRTYLGDKYFKSIVGEIEITLLNSFTNLIKPIIREPDKYDIITWEELKQM